MAGADHPARERRAPAGKSLRGPFGGPMPTSEGRRPETECQAYGSKGIPAGLV